MLESISDQLSNIVGICAAVCAVYYFGKYLSNLETSFVGRKLTEYSTREETGWLEMARQKYTVALAEYAASPTDKRAFERALGCGRHYSQICLEQDNDRLFNESVLHNDLARVQESSNFTDRPIQFSLTIGEID